MPIGQIVDPFASKAAESEAIDLATTLDPDIEKKIIMSGIIADELGLDGDFSGASYEAISKETGRTGNLDLDFQQEQLKAIGSSAKLNSKGLQAWSNGFKRGGIRAAQYGDSVPALLIQNRIEGLKTLADREKSFIERWNAGELEEQQEIAEKYNMQREASLLGFLWPKRMTSKEMFDNYSFSLPKYEEQIAKLEAQRDDQIKDFVRKQVNLLAIPVSEGLERFRTEEGSLTELFNPTTFGELLIEELTASSPSLVAMVGGSAVGGTVTGVGAGALATMAQSTSANFFGYLSQNGVDISDQQAVTEKLNDKEFFQEALDYAMLRAAPEAITESLAFASAGKIGSVAFNALGIQPGAAGLGALAADLIVGEDPSFKDIATEMIIELPVGSVEVLSQRLLNGSSAWKAMMMDEATPPDSRLIKKMVEATSMEEFTEGMTPEEALVLEKVIEDSPGAEGLVAKIVESQKAVEGLGIAEEFTPPREPIEVQEEELLLLAEGIRAAEAEAGVDLDVVDETVGVELEGKEMPIRPGDPRDKGIRPPVKDIDIEKRVSSDDVLNKVVQETEGQPDIRALNEQIKGASDFFIEVDVPVRDLEVQDADLVDPSRAKPEKGAVVIGAKGQIIDGRHRVALAKKQGQKTIKALVPLNLETQSVVMPQPKVAEPTVKAPEIKIRPISEERLRQSRSSLGLKLRATIRDLRKKHSDRVKEIKEEARQQARNKRWEESEKRRSVTEAIRQVEALHRKLNAKLPKGNKLKPMTVADISSKTKLEALESLLNKKLENIEANFQKEITAVKKANLEKELSKILKDIKQAKKGKKKTPWAPEYTKGLTDYLDLLGLTDNSEAARNQARLDLEDLNRRIDEQENYELTDEDNDIVERSQIPMLKEDLTEDIIDGISENVKAIKKEGVTKRKADVLNENRKIKALSETIKLELSKTKGRADAREVAQIRSFIAKYGSELATYQTMSVMLTGKKRSKLESLFDSISEAFSEGILMQQRFSGKNGLLEKKLEELEIDISSVGTNQLLTVGNRAMSIHEAMFVYGHNQNARGRGHLSATNFGGVALKGEQIRLIEEALPQKYKDLVDFVIDYFDNDVYPRLNNIYKKRFGVDMPKEERYLPITGLSNISAGSNIFNDHAQYAGFKMNNQKFRTGAKIGWGNRNLDFIGDVLSNVANTEHVIATYSTIRRAESVFNSEAVRKELNKSSDVAAQWIKKYLSKVARGTFDSPSSAIIELTSHLRQNAAASLTALNIASWLKTFAPLIAIKKDVEAGAWFDTLSDFGNYDKLHEFAVDSSKLMATRRDTNRIEVAELSEQSLRSRIIPTGEITSQVLSGYKKASKKFKEAGWAVYGALDSYSTTMAWTAKYKEVAGKTGDHDLAVKEADRIINVYFPSGRIDQLPFFFTSGGLEKQLTAFTADMNRMLNLGYSGTQLKDGKVREAIMFVAFPVVLSSLYLAGTDFIGDSLKEVIGLRDEDKEKDKQFWRDASRYGVSQFVGGIPFVGQLVEGKTAQLVGDDAAAWFLSQNNMVFTSAFQDAHRDNYISASSKLLGVPGANYFSYAADRYLKSITKQDKEKKKSISEKWDF